MKSSRNRNLNLGLLAWIVWPFFPGAIFAQEVLGTKTISESYVCSEGAGTHLFLLQRFEKLKCTDGGEVSLEKGVGLGFFFGSSGKFVLSCSGFSGTVNGIYYGMRSHYGTIIGGEEMRLFGEGKFCYLLGIKAGFGLSNSMVKIKLSKFPHYVTSP